MHISIKPTNLNFTVPVTSNTQRQTIQQPVLECRNLVAQHSTEQFNGNASGTFVTSDCDTEDEVNILSIPYLHSIYQIHSHTHKFMHTHLLCVIFTLKEHYGSNKLQEKCLVGNEHSKVG